MNAFDVNAPSPAGRAEPGARPGTDTTLAVDVEQHVRLGGRRQLIRVRAARPGLPSLLVLHGGPGFANGRAFLARHGELSQHFTVVTWDQRGAGASAIGSGLERLTLDGLVSDAAELVRYIRAHNDAPLYVLGLSWGSELGVRLVQRHPQGIAGYIGSGQAVDGVRGEELSWEWALDRSRERGDAWGERALRLVGPPVGGQYRPVVLGLALQRRVLARGANAGSWTAGVENPDGSDAPPRADGADPTRARGQLTPMAPSSLAPAESAPPEPAPTSRAPLPERIGAAIGVVRSLAQLWPTVTRYDFRVDAAALPAPAWILQGRHDHTTPSALVEEWVAVLQAPGLVVRWFEDSGHCPGYDEPEAFRAALIDVLHPGGTP